MAITVTSSLWGVPSSNIVTASAIARTVDSAVDTLSWARLIAKVFEVDPLRCVCGATMRVIAFILDPAVIRKVLEHQWRPEVRAHAPPAS
jgi:hypothetical protein